MIFGWALTPQPNIIPVNGSTITVSSTISGGAPGVQQLSHDVSTLFRDCRIRRVQWAITHRHYQLTNGLHSIAWSATDSANIHQRAGQPLLPVQN